MKKIVFVTSILFVASCSSLNAKAPFDSLASTVNERLGQKVIWNQSTEEDAEVERRVSKLLGGTITLDEAVEISLLNNLNLQAEYEDLGIAQAELVQAGLLQNPTLSLERRFKGKAFEADIVQNFLSLFLIPLKSKAADAELDATIDRVTQSVITHVGEIKKSYYSLQGEQQNLEMRQSVANALEGSFIAATALREAGNTSDLEVQNEATMLAQAKIALSEASERVLEEREGLNTLLGAWGENTGWRIETRLPELPVSEVSLSGLESSAITNRLDLLAAKNELKSIATQVGIKRYEALIPSFDAAFHYEREPEGKSSKGPSLVLPIPIFNWGQAASAQGEALFRQSLRRYQALAIDIRSKVRLSYGRMKAARARAEYFSKELLPLYKKSLEQTQLFYNGMFLGVFQLIQAKQAQINAGQSFVENLKEYWMHRTELEQAVGGSFNNLAMTTEKGEVANTIEPEIDKSIGHHHHHHNH